MRDCDLWAPEPKEDPRSYERDYELYLSYGNPSKKTFEEYRERLRESILEGLYE